MSESDTSQDGATGMRVPCPDARHDYFLYYSPPGGDADFAGWEVVCAICGHVTSRLREYHVVTEFDVVGAAEAILSDTDGTDR